MLGGIIRGIENKVVEGLSLILEEFSLELIGEIGGRFWVMCFGFVNSILG